MDIEHRAGHSPSLTLQQPPPIQSPKSPEEPNRAELRWSWATLAYPVDTNILVYEEGQVLPRHEPLVTSSGLNHRAIRLAAGGPSPIGLGHHLHATLLHNRRQPGASLPSSRP